MNSSARNAGETSGPLPAANPITLQDLLRRVESASGPLRALDLEVWFWLNQDPEAAPVPHLTASLDAALALVERVLPGWEFALEVERSTDGPTIWRVSMGDPLRGWTAEAPTPALALVAALLEAVTASGLAAGTHEQVSPPFRDEPK